MGKDSKPKDAGAKGKQAGGGSDENASEGKGKSGKASYGLGTCTYVKGIYYVRNKARSMRHTRSCRMVGYATVTRFLQLSLQRWWCR
ncbi:hypothetical protein BDE02_10G147000 [Populus trichocarpa]|nr:hypothetical protein BDE02_10G147000 [Populus trichocarpa]